ncbi:hypothetical protein ES707_14516 [subsurface metagenome]
MGGLYLNNLISHFIFSKNYLDIIFDIANKRGEQ